MCRQNACVDCQQLFVCPARRGPISKRCGPCQKAADLARSRQSNRKKADAGYSRVCLYCNCHWLARHPKSKFCSRNCQYLSSGGRVLLTCQQCDKKFTTNLTRKAQGHRFCGRACMREALRPIAKNCIECGKQFRRSPKGPNGKNDKALYCSKPCYFTALRAGRVLQDKAAIERGRWHRGGRYASAPSVRWARTLDHAMRGVHQHGAGLWEALAATKWCEACGNACKPGASRFCSYECNKNWREPRQCKCGETVENASPFGRPPHCEECRKKSRRIQRRMFRDYRRRCRTYGGHFNGLVKPIDVFKRDRYVCHICHKKTHKVFHSKDPLSATVDHHPIPLSKGGDHDWHNVRCACKRCNELKGNKWDGQRRLPLTARA